MFELRKFFCAIIAILAVVRVCGGRTDMPENPFSMQLSVLDELTLGMSVEEVIRARPNARRLVGIDPAIAAITGCHRTTMTRLYRNGVRQRNDLPSWTFHSAYYGHVRRERREIGRYFVKSNVRRTPSP